MKLSVRNGVFETNSSSVHAIVLMSRESYDTWQDDKGYIDISYDLEGNYPRIIQYPEFVTKEAATRRRDEDDNWLPGKTTEDQRYIYAGQIPYDIVEKFNSGEDLYPLVRAFLVDYKDWLGHDMVQLQLIIEG